MRVSVDVTLCQGHGQCQEAAPEVFEVRDDGLAHVLVDEVTDAGLVAKVEEAVRRCPADAIVVDS